MSDSRFVTRVMAQNYKSIAVCDVALGPLTIIVGPNGSGKSNFLDVLRFVADALGMSLDFAMRERGGLDNVRRRSRGHPHNFGIRLDLHLPDGSVGKYGFQVEPAGRGGYAVKREDCWLNRDGRHAWFRVERGEVVESSENPHPPALKDRLFLVNAAGLPVFRPLYDALASMGFYNINPKAVRDIQDPDEGRLLVRDGGNLASVLDRLGREESGIKNSIQEFLSEIVPGVSGVEVKAIGPKETLEFRQFVSGDRHPWRFLATSMSDGTLRVLGILVALFQGGGHTNVPLVGIEEPEVALHPAAAGLLMGALRKASRFTQVLVTSHSPDLLDDPDLTDREILAVQATGNQTRIAEVDQASRDSLRQHLYTPGELLRLDQLAPAVDSFESGEQRSGTHQL